MNLARRQVWRSPYGSTEWTVTHTWTMPDGTRWFELTSTAGSRRRLLEAPTGWRRIN